MKKVLFFDTWSRGMRFTDAVAEDLKVAGIDAVFLHFDSKYNADRTEVNERYSAIHDIAEFGRSVTKALISIRPDVIVLISMHGLTHRWVNFVAEILQVPVVFFPHGVRLSGVKISTRKISKWLWINKAVSRGFFYLSEWILIFLDILRFRKSIPIVIVQSFYEFFADNNRFSNEPYYKWGLNFDLIFLNIKEENLYFSQFIGDGASRKVKYIVSGHQESSSALKGLRLSNNNDNVLFISQPMVSWGVVDAEDWQRILTKVFRLLTSRFSRVSVRAHPRDDACNVALYESLGLHISQLDLKEDLAGNSLFFGFNSALIIGLMQAGATTVSIESDGLPKFPRIDGVPNFCQVNIDKLEEFLDSEFFSIERDSFIVKERDDNVIVNGILEYVLGV